MISQNELREIILNTVQKTEEVSDLALSSISAPGAGPSEMDWRSLISIYATFQESKMVLRLYNQHYNEPEFKGAEEGIDKVIRNYEERLIKLLRKTGAIKE